MGVSVTSLIILCMEYLLDCLTVSHLRLLQDRPVHRHYGLTWDPGSEAGREMSPFLWPQGSC